jgi:hypothetical protein
VKSAATFRSHNHPRKILMNLTRYQCVHAVIDCHTIEFPKFLHFEMRPAEARGAGVGRARDLPPAPGTVTVTDTDRTGDLRLDWHDRC